MGSTVAHVTCGQGPRPLELDSLIHRFRGPLAGLFATWGVPWHDAHELAQDTFVAAYLSRDAFRGDLANTDQVGRWLRGIARNLFRLWSRRRNRHSAEPIEDHDPVIPTVERDAPDVVALRRAVDLLPAKLRSVIYMHYLEATAIDEVASLLRVRKKTIEGRLYRARQILRERLQACANTAGRLEEASS